MDLKKYIIKLSLKLWNVASIDQLLDYHYNYDITYTLEDGVIKEVH